jgi:hypothetical protein
LSSNSVAIHDLPDLVIHSLPDMWPRAIFSRDYCRDIGDSARIAEDEQEHELFTGKRFHRPSISLFRNSNVVNYALIGGAPHGSSYRSLPLILCALITRRMGARAPRAQAPNRDNERQTSFQGSEIEPAQWRRTRRATKFVCFEK